MRGVYKSGQRRVLVGSGYKIAIGVVVALAVALVMLLLAFLPAMEDEITVERKIVSIENESGDIGVNVNPAAVYIKITYSDGSYESVPLSSTVYEGLDLSVAGQNNVALSYGGFEQTVSFNVKDVDCVIRYDHSVGGSIQGEAVQYVPNGGSADTVIAVPETGYVFVEWNDGYPLATRKDVGITESKTYSAIFEKAQYTVRFYYYNGTVATEEKVTYGEGASKIPVDGADPGMERYGYTFVGWTPTDYTSVDRDMVIRPVYEKTATDVIMTIPADIYGNDMGSTDLRSEGYYAHDQLATIVATPYNSRVFSRWLITGTDGSVVEVDKEGTASAKVGITGQEVTFTSTKAGNTVSDYQLSFTPTADVSQIKIQAIFAYDTFDVTFINYQKTDNNSVEYTVQGVKSGKTLGYATEKEFPESDGLPVPSDVNGMEFLGWYESGDSSQTIITKDAEFEQPTTLIAKWQRKQYKLQFVYQDPSGVKKDEIVHETVVTYQESFASGTNGGLPAQNPTAKNYVFAGWIDALTGATVDDKTKLYYDGAYANTEDFANNIVRFVPVWQPISHSLSVKLLGGAGKATLIADPGKTDTDGNDISEKQVLNGETTIYENRSYKLIVEAQEGYELVSYVWIYNNTNATSKAFLENSTYAELEVMYDTDNIITVNLQVKKVEIAVKNGDGYYAGQIAFDGAVYQGAEERFVVDYNSAATIKISSGNDIYAISDILVDGTSVGVNFDSDTLEYTLVLPALKTDRSIEVIYNIRKYYVWTESLVGGEIVSADLFNLATEESFSSGEEYAYGDKVYLRIKADETERKVISAIRINGIIIDLYTATVDDVRLGNWKINGVGYGITICQINGEYYYNYGQTSYDGTTYLYCETIQEGTATVFKESVDGEDKVYFAVSAAGNELLYSKITADLGIADKRLSDTSIARDNRLTSVDILIDVASDYNIGVSFRPISYFVKAEAEGDGTVEITDANPSYNGSTVLTAKPSAGYYVKGYSINGGDFVEADFGKKGEDYLLELNNIDCDKNVEFVFETISYKVTFENATPSVGEVYVDAERLNNSLSFDCEHHASIEKTVSINGENLCIDKVIVKNIDGTEQQKTLHFNTTEYVHRIGDVTGPVTIKIYLTEKAQPAVAPYTIDIGNSSLNHASVSAEFDADSKEYSVQVIADYGYRISQITVRAYDSSKTLDSSVTAGAVGQSAYLWTMGEEEFSAGTNVVVVVATTQERYSLTTESSGEGSISSGKELRYGQEEQVEISANQNCYIAAVYLNGEALSFRSSYWESLKTDGSNGNYVSGIITFTPEKNMDIKVEFLRNTYKMTIDAGSINGTTTLSVNKNNESEEGSYDVDGIADGSKSEYVPHGWFVSVNMRADSGYHVSKLYINDVEMELDFVNSDKNARQTATYIYKGNLVENKRAGATGRITVRVEYEINTYGFTYSIVNASENFSSDAFCGTVTSSYALSGNKYSGIEHGSNFAFAVTPSVANGYYLKQIRMLYKSASDSEVSEIIVKPGEGALSDITSSGGSVWFNRLIDKNDGITADIELIEVTFDRNLYEIELLQDSDKHTGTTSIAFSHGSADVSYIIIRDADSNKYYYRDGTFFVLGESGYVDSGIELRNLSGRYAFVDEDNTEHTMLIEHGLRYTVYAVPSVGYERIAFGINGEDVLSRVSDNRYSTNVDRNLTISAEYRILTYDISFEAVVYNKERTAKVSATDISAYAEIYIEVVSGELYYLDYSPVNTGKEWFGLEYGDERILLSTADGVGYKLGYGSRIRFVMVPNYDSKGYKLSSFVLTDTDITSRVSTAVRQDIPTASGENRTVSYYGGSDPDAGYLVVDDIRARSVFDVTRFSIYTEVVYTDGVVGETANYLKEESGLTIAWGDYADVRVEVADGFVLNSVKVVRGSDEYNANLTDSADNDSYDEQMYYNKRNSSTNEYRDVLRVRKVKTDVYLTAYIDRNEYQVRYKINDRTKLYEIKTDYNSYHSGYPTSSVSSLGSGASSSDGYWSDSVYIVTARHFDELAVTVTPANGYRIMPMGDGINMEYKVIVRGVKYDEAQGVWTYLKDNAGNPIATELSFGSVTDDIRSFTFHAATSPVATTYVSCDIEIEINIAVKTYETTASVGYIDAVGKENKNTTSVVWRVYDTASSEEYSDYDMTVNSPSASTVVNHHGKMVFEFTAKSGYRLSAVTINGKQRKNLETAGRYSNTGGEERTDYSDDDMSYYIVRRQDEDGNYVYHYVLTFAINDALIKGGYSMAQTAIEAYLEVSPIQYEMKTYINGVYYEQAVYGGVRGTSDGSTVVINGPVKAEHYNTFTLTPVLYEGYTVKSLDIRTGAYDCSFADADGTSFVTSSPNSSKTLSATFAFMNNINLLLDKTTIHIGYNTEILSYKVAIDAYAYSKDDGIVKRDADNNIVDTVGGYIDFDTAVGNVSAYVLRDGARVELNNGAAYDYFSEIIIEAYALDGYVMYEILEIVDGQEVYVTNGERGIDYYSEDVAGNTRYVIRYTVDKLADRNFKVVFKQKTTVTVKVIDPYKYTSGNAIGNLVYENYVSLVAKQNGVVLNDKNDTGAAVKTEYKYDVLVGNYVSLLYTDLHRNQDQVEYDFCTYNAATDNYISAGLTKNGTSADGVGTTVEGAMELYIINNVRSRITFEKETYGAVEGSSGGIVYFNDSGVEPSAGYLSSSATRTNSVLKITVKPNENYIFSNLYVRQRDVSASVAAGRIIYCTGSSEWLMYDDSFVDNDRNGFVIDKSVDSSGNTVFTVKITGDMELKFEFYRVYGVSYDAVFSDGSGYNDTETVSMTDISYNEYGEQHSKNGNYYVQYGSSFSLIAPTAPENYVFVGWYLNDVNTYVYLDMLLPTDEYYERHFVIDSSLEGLVVDGNETDKLVFVAMYQPVVTVAVINEAYYYDDSHWNSWKSGYLRTQYYNFDGKKVASSVSNGITRSSTSVALDDLTYSELAALSGGDNGWNLAKNSGAAGTNKVYSAMSIFSTLYQSITDYDLVNNGWENATITFNLDTLPEGLKHMGWQYYNWNTKSFENIDYVYEDENYGIDPSTGGYTQVDNMYLTYTFALSYLFSGEMPYAVSADNESNYGYDRPLIVRPSLHKVLSLQLSQKAYLVDLGDENNSETEFASVIHPTITSVQGSEEYYSIDDRYMSGEFDYGAVASIKYYDREGEDGVINYPLSDDDNIDMRYRFVGWRLYWKANGILTYRFISFADSIDIDLTHRFDDEPPTDNALQIEAVYIVQYKQSIYSYNVAGSDESYQEAYSGGNYSVNDAPGISVSFGASVQTFEQYDRTTGAVSNINLSYQKESLNDASQDRALQYYMDVGTQFTVIVKTNEREADVTKFVENNNNSNTNANTQGYDPSVDKFYALYYNKNTVGEEKADVLTYTGGSYKVESVYAIDLQYKSQGKLVFNNVMYGSGVTIPEAMRRYLGIEGKTTIWDKDTTYGGSGSTIDGVIEISFDLINATNMYGRFDYSLNGFADGNGITAMRNLYYTYRETSSSSSSNSGNLFNPTHASYRRYIVIDYNDGYISGGSLIFGNPNASDKYNTSNTGDGTESAPYKIYNVTQLINVGRYFYANENSCAAEVKNEYGAVAGSVPVYYKLFSNIALQDYTNSTTASAFPGGSSNAWVPLCYAAEGGGSEEAGFNGVFDGGGYTLYNLAVFAGGSPDTSNSAETNILSANQTTVNPLADLDYAGLAGYGIFGYVNGGTIKNVKIADAFVSLMDDTYESVGIVAARAKDAVFNNIQFVSNNSYATRTLLVMSDSGGARTYLVSQAKNTGMVVGSAKNSQIKNITLDVGTSSNIYVASEGSYSGNGVGTGALVGYAEANGMYSSNGTAIYGTEMAITDIVINGGGVKKIVINDSGISSAMVSGGIVGSVSNGMYIEGITMDDVNLIIGDESAKDTVEYVGGIVGKMSSSAMEAGVGIAIKSANATRSNTTTGIILRGSVATGAMIGTAINSVIDFDNSITSATYMEGVIRMRGANVGGVVGYSDNSEIIGVKLLGPDKSNGNLKLMIDQNEAKANAGEYNYGGIAGFSSGLITDSYVMGGYTGSDAKLSYTNIDGAFLYVYTSKNSSYNSVGNVTSSVATTVKNSATEIMGRVSVGGLVGMTTGRVYNSYVTATRITVRLDVNASDPVNYVDATTATVSGNSLVVSAGGIAGTLRGSALKNGELADGSDYGFMEEMNGFAESVVDGTLVYKTRIQSCFTSAVGVVIAHRIWIDSYDVAEMGAEMAPMSLTIGGIAGSTDGYVGAYGINSCYSLNDYFSRQFGAYGLTNYQGEEGNSTSKSYGWYYGKSGWWNVSDNWSYVAIRKGLRVHGGVFGIVGGEFLSEDYAAKGYGCNYCWCKGNTKATDNTVTSLDAFGVRSDDEGPVSTRGINTETNEYNRAYSSGHSEGNIACARTPYNVQYSSMYVTGMECYADSDSNTAAINGVNLTVSDMQKISVFAKGGFVGTFDSSSKKSTDGRVYRTDPKTGILIVASNLYLSEGYATFIDGTYRLHDGTYPSGSYSDYLVDGQTSNAITD